MRTLSNRRRDEAAKAPTLALKPNRAAISWAVGIACEAHARACDRNDSSSSARSAHFLTLTHLDPHVKDPAQQPKFFGRDRHRPFQLVLDLGGRQVVLRLDCLLVVYEFVIFLLSWWSVVGQSGRAP